LQERYGTTLIITTHDLKDIVETCDRLLLLDKGRLLFDGSIRQFERKYANERRITAELHHPLAPAAAARIAREVRRHGARVTVSEGHRLVVEYKREGATPALTQVLLRRLKVADINLEKPDIETIVARLYRKVPLDGKCP
jgi:ABC-2 type transport system ATP-binding protein